MVRNKKGLLFLYLFMTFCPLFPSFCIKKTLLVGNKNLKDIVKKNESSKNCAQVKYVLKISFKCKSSILNIYQGEVRSIIVYEYKESPVVQYKKDFESYMIKSL